MAQATLSKFEEGFNKYIETLEAHETQKANRGTITKKMNKAIQLMASEDFLTMQGLVEADWLIYRALRGWEPTKENRNAWHKIEE